MTPITPQNLTLDPILFGEGELEKLGVETIPVGLIRAVLAHECQNKLTLFLQHHV